jgi:hypothetical protein
MTFGDAILTVKSLVSKEFKCFGICRLYEIKVFTCFIFNGAQQQWYDSTWKIQSFFTLLTALKSILHVIDVLFFAADSRDPC